MSENCLKLLKGTPSSVVGADGTQIKVYGEIPLIVRFKSTVIDLQVRVVDHLIFPMILGMDWIDRSGAFVFSCNGTGYVDVLNSFSHAREELHKFSSQLIDKVIPSDLPSEPIASFSTTNPFRQDTGKTVVNEPKQEDPTYLATIDVEEVSSRYHQKDYEWLVVHSSTVIPPGSLQFISTKICSTIGNGHDWHVEKSYSAHPKCEWIVPQCVVKSKKDKLLIPVVNLSRQPLKWNQGSKLVRASAIPTVIPTASSKESDPVCSLEDPQNATLPEKTIGDIESDENLTMEERDGLLHLLGRHSHCFARLNNYSQTPEAEHSIETGTAVPIQGPPYRVSLAERKTIGAQVSEMLEKNVITPSVSPWAAPVVILKKRTDPIASAWITVA